MRRVGALAGIAILLLRSDAEACPGPPRERYAPWSFLGYACVGDCERHKAGFAWAEIRGVADPGTCASLDRPAREGCLAFVEQATTSEDAGYQWALENEVVERCLCEGAGERFRVGCQSQLVR